MHLEINFEWEDEKAKQNKQKHNVSFLLARRVFADEYRIEWFDEAHSEREDRFITIGTAGDSLLVLTVVYTERKDTIRIISARKANVRERREYYDRKDCVGR